MATQMMNNPQMMNSVMGDGGTGSGPNGEMSGNDMMDQASGMAMASGNPEAASAIMVTKMIGKYNTIYTIIIFIILAIFCWWIIAGMFCGSAISTDEGFEVSGNWSNGS